MEKESEQELLNLNRIQAGDTHMEMGQDFVPRGLGDAPAIGRNPGYEHLQV